MVITPNATKVDSSIRLPSEDPILLLLSVVVVVVVVVVGGWWS